MELQLLAQREENQRPRHDAVKLLSGSEDIGRAGEDGGEVVLADESLQMQIASRA